MGACILCGKSAGPFYSLHKNCYSKYEASKQEIAQVLSAQLNVVDTVQVATLVKQRITKFNYVEEAEKRTLNRTLEYFASEYIDNARLTHSEIKAWLDLLDALSPDDTLFVNPNFLAQQYNLHALHELRHASLPDSNRHPANYSIKMREREVLWWCFDNGEVEQDSAIEEKQQWSVLMQVLGSLFGNKQKPKLEKKTLGDGSLLVTNQRLYFESDTYTEQLDYLQIYSVTPINNGVRLQSNASTAKPLTYLCEDARLLFAFIKHGQAQLN